VAYLQERIRSFRHAIESCAPVIAYGIVFTIFGSILWSASMTSPFTETIGGLFAIITIIGVVLTISASASYFYYIDQIRKVTQQLREMAANTGIG